MLAQNSSQGVKSKNLPCNLCGRCSLALTSPPRILAEPTFELNVLLLLSPFAPWALRFVKDGKSARSLCLFTNKQSKVFLFNFTVERRNLPWPHFSKTRLAPCIYQCGMWWITGGIIWFFIWSQDKANMFEVWSGSFAQIKDRIGISDILWEKSPCWQKNAPPNKNQGLWPPNREEPGV